jgi:hypothetical protein
VAGRLAGAGVQALPNHPPPRQPACQLTFFPSTLPPPPPRAHPADIPRQSTVKLFCPRCEDVYYPRSKYHGNLDGAYFGTTFAHLFQLSYPAQRPAKPAGKLCASIVASCVDAWMAGGAS